MILVINKLNLTSNDTLSTDLKTEHNRKNEVVEFWLNFGFHMEKQK